MYYTHVQQVQLWRSRRSLTTALMWLLCFFNSSSFRWRFGIPMLASLSTRLVGSLGGAHFACGGVYFFGSLKAGLVEVLSQLSPSHWIPPWSTKSVQASYGQTRGMNITSEEHTVRQTHTDKCCNTHSSKYVHTYKHTYLKVIV